MAQARSQQAFTWPAVAAQRAGLGAAAGRRVV